MSTPAFFEGQQAAKRGATNFSCPYDPGTKAARDWYDGLTFEQLENYRSAPPTPFKKYLLIAAVIVAIIASFVAGMIWMSSALTGYPF